jgi:hypothetical protein
MQHPRKRTTWVVGPSRIALRVAVKLVPIGLAGDPLGPSAMGRLGLRGGHEHCRSVAQPLGLPNAFLGAVGLATPTVQLVSHCASPVGQSV